MKNFKTLFVILAVLLLLPTAAFASPVGKITYIEGNVDITAGDKVRPAALGEPVSAGEILRSKAKAKAEVTFLDGNILRLAEGTRVRITDYQMGEGKTTTLDLLRGKTQNIVTGLAKGAKYEVHTPTAVCGVRGTNFFTYLQGGASHFVPKENTIYGYNKKMPQDVKTVDPGLSIVIPGADLPPVIQPMTSVEIDKHTSDTAPGTPTQEPGKTAQQTFGGVSWEPPEEWTVHVPGEDVKYYADIVFPFTNAPPPEVITAQGRLGGVLGDTTGIGNADLTLQYAADGYGGFLAPQLEVGNLTGLMQDASGVSGVITSIPGSWLGAFSGIHYNSTGFGLFIGYLSGNYSEATGSVSANGYVTRTSILIPNDPSNLTPIGDYIGTIILPDQLNNLSIEVPLIEEVNVYSVNEGSSYVAFLYGDTMPDTHDMTYLSNIDDSLLSAWAVVNDSESLSYSNDAGRTTWVAKYGSMGYNYFGYYFIVGNITGTHPVSGGVTDFEHLLLSGRDLLYLSPGSYGFDDTDQYVYTPGLMGYYNLEYWYNIDPETGYSSYSGGAGTLELKPTAFGGYWGYGIGSLYTNDEGYAVRSAGELGALASWTEPWDAPADIKVAGMYWANWFHDYGYGGYGSYDGDFAPGYLLSASIGSRPDYEFLSEECGDPHFYNGDFFGLAAGVVGPLAQTDSGLWERATKAAIAALYVKEYVQEDETVVRKAGWLTTYTSGSAEGGLTGGLYPNEMEYGLYNYFRLDGTLTATPVDSGTTLSDYTLKYSFTDGIRAGYSGEDASIQGEGGLAAYYFNAYDSSVDKAYDRPWGIFSISIGGTSEWEYNDETEEYDLITSGNPALFFGPVSSLNGRDIQIGGGSKTPGAKASYWLGTVYSAAWTETIAGEGIGEINGPLSGYYLSQTDMGTFDGVFYGLYDGPCDFGGWWIGDAVGTYYGTRLTFSGKIQEDTYGIAGLWGSIDPIADDATAITGILGMGTYTTVPDGEWTAKTGGKWTTTGGNPVYWKANIGGSSFFNGTTAGGFTGALSTGTLSYDGFTASLSSGRYMSLLGEGTVSSTFTGIYYEEIGMWVAEEVEFTLGELTTLFAFSSVIDGLSYKASLTGDDDESTTFSLQEDGFQGIMGGVDYDGYGLTFLGRLDQLVFSQEAPYLSASAITSYIPATSDFTYTFGGFLAVATDSANTVSGDIRALYSYSPSTAESGSTPLNGYGGFGGIFYSDDIDGTYEPATGIWEAAGNPVFYQMIDYAPEGIIAMSQSADHEAGTVPVDVISGGTVDLRQADSLVQSFIGEPWGVWQSIYRGTYTGSTPLKWISIEENQSLLTATATGMNGAQYLLFNLAAPENGVSTGTVVGAQGIWGDADIASHTVVMGGVVKGIFDPITTPLTSSAWTAVMQGGYMKTDTFLAVQDGMSDSERTNLERATRIPAFDVGMGNLAGTVSDMTVSMNNIKFFRFQNEASPSIWATDGVSGTYTSSTKDYTGTTVMLSGSGGLSSSLTQTFQVQQWDTINSNWGASVSRGANGTDGTLARSAADQLRVPEAPATITITEMRGVAAGSINTTAQTFAGTAAGVVKTSP